jgi:uncharacterized membrane protein
MSKEPSRRLDQFVDAAFAFSVTLLVISDGAPDSIEALLDALLRAPAFAISFSLIAMFWLAHREYGRLIDHRSGLATALSLAIVFTVLVYVFPLRVLSESALHALSGGVLRGRYLLNSFDDLRTLYAVYASAFVVLSTLFVLLFATVVAALPEGENVARAREWRRTMGVLLIAGLLSGILSFALPLDQIPWAPGVVYGLIPIGIGAASVFAAGERAARRARVVK